jgi:hypothetical protein
VRVFLILQARIGGYKKIIIKLSKQDQKQRPKPLTGLEIKIALNHDGFRATTISLYGFREIIMARPEGLEPPVYWSVASRSIQLSHGRI